MYCGSGSKPFHSQINPNPSTNFKNFWRLTRRELTVELVECFLNVGAVLEAGVEVVDVERGGGRHFAPHNRVPEAQHTSAILHKC